MAKVQNRPGVSRDVIDSWLVDDHAVRDVAAYFTDAQNPARTPPWTGSRFETLAGGGDRPDVAHQITADDLVAVSLLSVTVPPRTALNLLDGPLGLRLTEHLKAVPPEAAITDANAAELLAGDGHLTHAWQTLEAEPKVGWVTAGKLLARKRPHLVPVYDNVVRCAFGRPRGFWLWIAGVLRDPELVSTLERIRDKAEAPGHVSPLRVLDVIVWMRHHQEHARSCLH